MLLLKGRFLCKRQNRAQESAILTSFQVMLIELVFGPIFTCKVLKHLSRFCCSHVWASLVAQIGKVSTCNVGGLGLIPGLGRSPVRERLPTPVFWPREFHEQRSLVGYSPWGHKESDTTEWLSLSFVYIYRLPGWLSW